MKTRFVKPADANRKWVLIDAEGVPMGRVAVKAASILRGKHKASFTPNLETGDYVVIINAAKAVVTGKKVTDKIYYKHSGSPGGLTSESYETLLDRKPTAPMEKAIKGMLPSGPLGNQLFRNVKVYAGAEHPHAAQQPEVVVLK